ncbi:copper-sensing two-component system response regulator CpxR [Vibrio ponticus]|nr:copper-sensing two-component system response regulator CpxR [Vibrio ponticus]
MFDSGGISSSYSGEIENVSSHRSTSILLVEDDITLNHQLTILLENKGYIVRSFHCGAEALSELKHNTFDLVVLDINLPNVDGFGLLNYIRSHSKMPAIMLTAYGAEEHRIQGLRFGADDYISKPCNFEEVSLRIEAVLRRTQNQTLPSSSRYLTYQELSLDKQKYQVTVDSEKGNHAVTLTPIQFKLLWVLVQNSDQVQSKPYLYQAVLEREFSQYDRSLDMHLSRVRKLLTQHGMDKDRIKTIHGKGYLLK